MSERTELTMICTCSQKGAAEADEARKAALKYFDCKPEFLVTEICHSLDSIEGSWYITKIATDMWSGVELKSYEFGDSSVYVQCDFVEDGIIAAWGYLRDTYGFTD